MCQFQINIWKNLILDSNRSGFYRSSLMWKESIFSDLNREQLASIWQIANLFEVSSGAHSRSELITAITENQSKKCYLK